MIVGGGVMGASIAYHLATKGIKGIVLLEKEELGSGSTGRSAACIRHHYSNRVTAEMAHQSRQVFENFEELTGHPSDFRKTGYLVLVPPGDEAAFRENLALHREVGIAVEEVSLEEVKRIFPQVRTEDLAAAGYERDSGYAEPLSVTSGFARRARELGAEIRLGTRLIGIRVSGGRVQAAMTDRGEIETGTIVNAAGPWAALVGKMAGVELPVKPYRRQSFATEPFPEIPEDAPFIVDFTTSFYFHKEPNGGVLMGMSDRDEPSSFNTNVDWSFLERVVEQALHRAPILGEAKVIRGWAGLYAVTPDNNPIVGRTPVENFYVACGFSGHGFMHAPTVGRLLAELVSGKELHMDITTLSLERFAQETIAEYNVI